jgi:hypothetical protein
MLTKRVAGIVLALALAAVSLPAQNKSEDTNTRTVQGVVTDASGNPVAGAVVQLKDTKTLQVRSFRTQQDGTYHFAGLSTNVDYELKAESDGASSGTKMLSVFDGRKVAEIHLKLNKK